MKRRQRADRFAREQERGGYIFSTASTSPLPSWMQDPKLLPKSPPKPVKPQRRP